MSKTTHTPGPWLVEDDNSIMAEVGAHICTVMMADDFPCIEDDDRDIVDAECKANAALIAASPDILLALRPLVSIANAILGEAPANADNVSIFQDCNGHAHRVTMDELRAVVVAVAKAEGGDA